MIGCWRIETAWLQCLYNTHTHRAAFSFTSYQRRFKQRAVKMASGNMVARDFEDVDVGAFKYCLPTKPNNHKGFMCTIYDSNGSLVFFKTPEVKIPFEPVFGGLTVFEGYQETPDNEDDPRPTEFSKWMECVQNACYASFNKLREDKASKGIEWGSEDTPPYGIVHKKRSHDDKNNLYTDMKYQFKVAQNGEEYAFEMLDHFNNKCKFSPGQGVRAQLLVQVHSWYYDGQRKKFHTRLYIRGIKLAAPKDVGKDIRQWLDNPQNIF